MSSDWKEGFGEITKKPHRDQAKWFLNAFWNDGMEDSAEKVWEITHHFIELDIGKPLRYGKKKQVFEEGCDLDEVASHRILEKLGETLTVLALRKRLAKLDIDANNRMALSEYLLDKFSQKPDKLVNAPQGTLDNSELEAAQAKLDEAGEALFLAIELKRECDIAEAPLKKANEALKQCVDEIEEMEAKRAKKIEKLDLTINDKRKSSVSIGRATLEKEGLLSQDPLPLRKAKITQNAQLKKVKKARKPFKKATAAAEAAQKDSEEKNQEALDFLNKLKSKGGTPHGSLWWMQRELDEKKKYMPNK